MASTINLQSQETVKILNIIDKLRSLGIGDVLELPQIIVCGDQSSGKSAVLNAISTLRFPSKDTLCTRFATEVIMRPGPSEPILVSIVPGSDRSHAEKRSLEEFRKTNVSMDDIATIIEEATERMGIDPRDPQAKRFSNDILRFEVTGPGQPSLTLVDLPGLFQAPSKDQTDEDTESVRKLVLTYMKNKRSVILAVISAKSDFVLQSVTKYSREVDPRGLRTLGVITKPDKLDVGSEMEKNFMELARNRLAFLHRGWHVLVNRDYTQRDFTQDERDKSEKEFLSTGVWARLPNNHKGVFSLTTRLTGLLRDQILEELPNLMQDIESEVEKQKKRLDDLGMPRANPEDQRRYLIQCSQRFNMLMRLCINKPYDDEFFSDHTTESGAKKCLRAIIQKALTDFARDMQSRGHAKHIRTSIDQNNTRHPNCITQEEFEDEVMELIERTRGRELMGTFDPLVIRELFIMQSKPWNGLIQEYRHRIWEAVKITTDLVLKSSTDEITMQRLKHQIIEPHLSQLGTSLDDMVRALLSTCNQHPITYNRCMTDNIQKAKQAHAEKLVKAKVAQAIDTRRDTFATVTLEWALQVQSPIELVELERYAASEAIELMRAYYKLTKERMVDNFSSIAVEKCLISHLPDLLSPEKIAQLDDDTVSTIAIETDTATTERAEAQERLQISEAALNQLRTIEHLRPPLVAVETHSERVDFMKQDVGAEDSTQAPSSLAQSTDISKLDLGSSDQEGEGVEHSINDSVLAPSEPPITKKKRTKIRDSWVNHQLNGEF